MKKVVIIVVFILFVGIAVKVISSRSIPEPLEPNFETLDENFHFVSPTTNLKKTDSNSQTSKPNKKPQSNNKKTTYGVGEKATLYDIDIILVNVYESNGSDFF